MKTKMIFSLILGLLLATVFSVTIAQVTDIPLVGLLIVTGVAQFIPMPGSSLCFAFTFTDLLWADGEDNMGGIQTVGYFALIDDIATFPTLPADSAELSGTFVMNALKSFFKIYSTQETAFVNDENQGETDGQSFVHNASIFFPGTKSEALSFARKINNSNSVFILIDAEGQRRVIGSVAFPAKCKPSFATGAATADRKGMTMEIKSYGNTPAPTYDGIIPLSDGDVPAVS